MEGSDEYCGLTCGLVVFLWVSNLVPFGRGDPRQSIVTQTRAILGNKACSDTRPDDRAPTLLQHVFCLLASMQLPEEEVARQVSLYFESCGGITAQQLS